MRFAFAVILGCALYLALQVEAGKRFQDKEGFYFEARPRLGHFANYPYTKLYEEYASKFVRPLFPGREADHPENYAPSGDSCMVFFTEFRAQEYKVRDLDQVVVLDACLGYLYESTFHDADKEKSSYTKENLDALIADEKLRALYEGTKINDLSDAGQDCAGDLLLNSIRAKKEFKDKTCNEQWLKLFNEFAECHNEISAEARETDTYIKMIYDLVKVRGRECFHHEISALNQAVRKTYERSAKDRLTNPVTKYFSSIKEQAHARIWPSEIVKVLRAVQNPKKEINLRRIAEILKGVYEGNQGFIKVLLDQLSASATRDIKPKREKPEGDPTGVLRYKKYVDKLCNFFRASDNDKDYDYTTPFKHMIHMIDFPEIYDISREYFIKNVLTQSFETAPLYLGVSSCNVISFTEGSIPVPPQNHAQEYRVTFKPNLSKMVVWPDIGFR